MFERTRRMTMVATSLLLGTAAAGGLMVEAALAQGTPQQQMACQSDAFRLCGQFIPDVTSVRICMVKRIRSLSPDCRAEFAKARKGQSARQRSR